jgi:hypothetical protein
MQVLREGLLHKNARSDTPGIYGSRNPANDILKSALNHSLW